MCNPTGEIREYVARVVVTARFWVIAPIIMVCRNKLVIMGNGRKRVPKDHPFHDTFAATDKRRTEKELDDIFDFGTNNLEREDVTVSSGKGGGKVEPSGRLSDDEFETFTEKAKASDTLGWDPMDKSNYAKTNELETQTPAGAHFGRSAEAAKQDTRREAPVTTDPEKYANNPDEYDYPFLDTTKEFREKYGDKPNAFERIDEKAGADDVLHDW